MRIDAYYYQETDGYLYVGASALMGQSPLCQMFGGSMERRREKEKLGRQSVFSKKFLLCKINSFFSVYSVCCPDLDRPG